MDPIHEQMHVEAISLTGGTLHVREQSLVQWSGGNRDLILFAGYHGEIWLYFLMALLFKRAGAFFGGAGVACGPLAVASHDFSLLQPGALAAHLFVWVVLYSILAYVMWSRLSAPPVRSPSYSARSILR